MSMKKKLISRKKGFTLIEVIIAVSIVVILSSLSVPKITGYLDKAKGSKAVSIGRQIYTAAMWSYSEKGSNFDGQSVLSAIQDTTSVQGISYNTSGSSSSIVVTDSRNISISFTSDSKNYLIEINGDNNSYTIKNISANPAKQVFSSIQ
jgi:type IV pilus assembly protein PilA